MSFILTKVSLKKNNLSRPNNSNKNIFIKQNLRQKTDDLNKQNQIQEKNITKKNSNITNTSVKINKQLKKVSINDYENKKLFLKNRNQDSNNKNNNKINNNNKTLLIKKNTLLKTKKKLDLDNKENQINNKEKNENIKKQKTTLKMMVNNARIKIKQNFPKLEKNLKTQVFNKNNGSNKLKKIILDYEKNTDKEIITQKIEKRNIKKNDKNKIKEIGINKTLMIENGKPNEEKEEFEENEDNKFINISRDDDIQYFFKYERNTKSAQTLDIIASNSTDKINPLFNMKKEHIKYTLEKRLEKPSFNIIHRKINSEDKSLNDNNQKIYNSINQEKQNNKNYMDLINNFDIINIISKKEQYKKLSRSIKNNLNNMNEITEENFIKQYPQLKKKFKLNGLNIVYNDSIDISKEKEKEITNDEICTAKTMRNINPLYKNVNLLNQNKKEPNKISNKTPINKDIININNNNILLQNKWNKNYFIPVVSATLVKEDENKKQKKIFYRKKKDNNDKTKIKDISDNINSNFNYNNYNTNPNIKKQHVNFCDNNKKKREILFNFNNKLIKNETVKFLRNKSFVNKRNMHITERNNSINNTINDSYNNLLNKDNDLDIQEKKLKLICSEMNKYKFRKKFQNLKRCDFSLDQKSNKSNNNISDENNEDEIDIKIKDNNKLLRSGEVKKNYKTFHIKINPLNLIKIKNNNCINGNKLIVKRGDLLNRLRKIKQNYTNIEVSSIN